MQACRRSARSPLWILPLALVVFAAAIPAIGEDKPKAADPEKVVVVTKGNPGIQYRGVFYPSGMEVEEFVRLFGEPETRVSETDWRYDTRHVNVHADSVDGDPKRKQILSMTVLVRDPRLENDPPAKQVVTDSGIDHRGTPADVEKAHGKPTGVKEREDGRTTLRYVFRNEGEIESLGLSFGFKGETLEYIRVSAHRIGPAPRATTVPAATTRPSRPAVPKAPGN
jgi:hypothetical protein